MICIVFRCLVCVGLCVVLLVVCDGVVVVSVSVEMRVVVRGCWCGRVMVVVVLRG